MSDLLPLTEHDIAEFLLQTPAFFERYASVLATVRLASPHGGRAVSLQERQAELLRDKIKVLEQRFMALIRSGNDNSLLQQKLHDWVRQLLLAHDAKHLPDVVLHGLRDTFDVPQVALRLWDLAEPSAPDAAYAQPVSTQARQLAASLHEPYCGVNSGFEPAQWLDDPAAAASLVLLPLREGPSVFGLLVLASPDASRYQAAMATDLLERIAELASAALARLREKPDADPAS